MPDEGLTRPVQRHLLTVWNPAYTAGDAMEAHLRILLEHARRAHGARPAGGRDAIDEDDVYVWWGKIRSVNRLQPMPHLQDVLAIDAELQGRGESDTVSASREVQLYLTDYRSLYVAHVAEITADDVRQSAGEAGHVPPMYGPEVHCDCWFRLFDIRRVVLDDTLAVVEELKKLRNTRYHDRPVSIYGGIIELPLIVTRDDGARWFDPAVRERLTDGRFWVEFDAELSGVGAIAADLRDNVLGDQAWSALDPAARTFVATAEKLFRDHRQDAAFDFSPVVVNLAKAWEVQLGALFGAVWRRFPDDACWVNVDGRTTHLFDRAPAGLGTLARAIGEHRPLRDALPRRLGHATWVTASMPAVIGELAQARNDGAHRGRIAREVAGALRNAHLGVGMPGHLVELARVRAVG